MIAALWWVWVGCSSPEGCDAMCAAGVARAAACGADATSWEESCETWAWEQTILARDADRLPELETACAERKERFTEGDCESFLGEDWNEPVAW